MNDKKKLNPLVLGVYGFAIANTMYVGTIFFSVGSQINELCKEREHIKSNLDITALKLNDQNELVNSVDFKSHQMKLDGQGIIYLDLDSDEDFESFYLRKNSNNGLVKITVQNLEGKLDFPTLANNAVNPLQVPEKPTGLEVDYIDVNNYGKLESLTRIGSQRFQIELVNGEYTLNKLVQTK